LAAFADRASSGLVLGISSYDAVLVLAGREPMNPADQSPDPAEAADQIDEAALAEVMRVTPLGAGVVAGTAVALLVLGYLAIYLLVFLPRGTVG
jgi:hypothetical protein